MAYRDDWSLADVAEYDGVDPEKPILFVADGNVIPIFFSSTLRDIEPSHMKSYYSPILFYSLNTEIFMPQTRSSMSSPQVYNVWRGRDFYGVGAAYNCFAGNIAARFLFFSHRCNYLFAVDRERCYENVGEGAPDT